MLGYRHDLEDWDYLRANSVQFPAACCAAGEIPDDFHPQLITKNQKTTSSCVGHGLSTMAAALNLLITGQEVNYSAWFAYLQAQRHSFFVNGGIRYSMLGSDDGANLAGAMEAFKLGGLCRDELLPFPGYYTTNLPKAAVDEAKDHLLLQFAELRGYDEVWRYVSSFQGPVLIGTEWYEGNDSLRGDPVETRAKCRRGNSRGYHCRCVIGWSNRRDEQGRRYLRCKNSHSAAWGVNGESEIEPAFFDDWANDRFAAFFGASESRPYEPRPVAWLDHKFVVC